MTFDSVTSKNDLEFGGIEISKNMRKILRYYENNKKLIKKTGMAFIVLTLALILKGSLNNIEKVQDTVITFDEETYKTFILNDNLDPDVDNDKIKQFHVKNSKINQQLQIMNLESVENKIKKYLDSTNDICIHARHFGCEYDILVFQNITVINPEIVSTSNTMKNIKEKHLNGEKVFHKRFTEITINYLDKKLNQKYDKVLYGTQAICFQHYIL